MIAATQLQFEQLAARFCGTSLLCSEHVHAALTGLRVLAADPHALDMLGECAAADDGFWPAPDHWMAKYRPYVVVDGMLQIPVKGMLLHDFSFAIGSAATGYVYIWRAYERGMADPEVKGVALICHSPGGEVAGCMDLVDRMAANKTKPVRAFAHEGAYSAGYAIASVADRIVVSRTGGVGSIGTLTMHIDVSKAYADAGYAVTLIDAPQGGHKTDGSPFKPLSDAARARMQARIDTLYGEFVATVARNRPQLTAAKIRATQALTYTAQDAVDVDLADAIGSLDDAVAAFAADLSSNEGDETMTTTPAAAATFSQADLDRARAEGHASGRTEGMKLGAEGERARIAAILDHAEAQGREPLARHYAFKTDSAADAAVEAMKAAPKATAAAAPVDPIAALAAGADVTVGADPAQQRKPDAKAAWDKVTARVNANNGFGGK